MSLVVAIIAAKTVLYTDNPDHLSVSSVYEERAYRLRLMISEHEPVYPHRNGTVSAIQIETKRLKQIQHGMITLPFWWPMVHQYSAYIKRKRHD
ncbi:hypothetical protein [Roseovarius Plymouth podovirus 1]|uniref:Uncharacterized protein n=1 Tax=Roseovarius Plymouth podovirus 1 TaxID=926474 RepID=K4Q568_9CAUD|nr:hypothetical protein HYO70_gp91 [Roseovarius Plymouth podovirus 1]CBX88013.1 hypothetical protein [Roseovarius Plymouth podovirus 1]